ncbi:MAG: HAMP domain-containing sensor histidine kinase [Bacteroidota bacterium]
MIRLCIIFGLLLAISSGPLQSRNPHLSHLEPKSQTYKFDSYHQKVWEVFEKNPTLAATYADSAYYYSLHNENQENQLTALIDLVLIHGTLQNHKKAEAYLSEASCINPSVDSLIISPLNLRENIPASFFQEPTPKWYDHYSTPLLILGLLGIYLASLLFVRYKTKKAIYDERPVTDPIEDEAWDIRKVAHDLKTPLSKIEGLSKMVSDSGKLNANQRYYLEIIQKVVTEGQEMIQLMLSGNNHPLFSALNDEVFSLEELLLTQLPSFNSVAQLKEIHIVKELTAEHPMMQGNPVALLRVFDNLMSNAIKFSPVGGNVYVNLEDEEGTLTLSIRDEGEGINPKDLSKIFSHPKKISTRPTAGESSNGLGLGIVKELVEEMDGAVSIESTVGLGTTIQITFPAIPHPTVQS